jgi:hypothetical protein
MGKHEKAGTTADMEQSTENAIPPAYDTRRITSLSPEDVDQLNSAFSSLNLPLVSHKVTQDTCLAHLKLLFALQTLKEAIGYTDGLWQIYDSRLFPGRKNASIEKVDDETKRNLALLREKRWALYVARAVDRYEAWWGSLSSDPLTEIDMGEDTVKYTAFTSGFNNIAANHVWKNNNLPPLGKDPVHLPSISIANFPIDVLMVWHAHMLNPRAYAEDCMRRGLRELWQAGMPWQLINEAIDTNFNYKVSPDCMTTWEETTRRKWENADDPSTKQIPPCPYCSTKNIVPWSTCGMAEDSPDEPPAVIGHGYGDGDFKTKCSMCGKELTRDYLEVFKFTTDVKNLLAHDHPMPGTLLDNKTGTPKKLPAAGILRDRFQRTFPNRLIRNHIRSRLLDPPPASVDAIRQIIENALVDTAAIKLVENVTGTEALRRYHLGIEARIHVRKMMSRYWGNSSPFALELGGAVVRQGIFTEKMYKVCLSPLICLPSPSF